MFNTSTLTDKQ